MAVVGKTLLSSVAFLMSHHLSRRLAMTQRLETISVRVQVNLGGHDQAYFCNGR
jgi:hypothetical protein